ncbi:MAG: SpoIIE family protein phosphatase [Spirochaetes bacterium]|nr:SpoIIE family protein phosphatase [Spirochaetota bacterium]
MDSFININVYNALNIYIVPPFLSLVLGITLAVISIAKGKLKAENVLFSLLCIWWSLLSPVFICHHLFRGNEELLLAIERRVHFFYVYLPPLNILFFYKITGIRSRFILPAMFVVSFLLSLTTFTDYYFYGFYEYSWGYIAKGGIAFHIVALFASIFIIYLIIFFIRKIRTEKNHILRLKLKYILFSFILIGLLTLANIPAINGIDVYPFGNMMFLPLAFLGYGVLSYRLMDIRSVLHVTLMWAIMSSLIIIPNVILFMVLYPYLITRSPGGLLAIGAAWFYCNYLYLSRTQPLIDRLFNKGKYDLHKIESLFIDNISRLKSVDNLLEQFIDVITKSLAFRYGTVIICREDVRSVLHGEFAFVGLDEETSEWFVRTNHMVDRDMVESKESYAEIRDRLRVVFSRHNARYLIPIVQMNELAALMVLPEKQNLRQLKHYEVVFINNIRSALVISIENAIMYGNLNMLKDNLEQIVIDRTSELIEARDLLLHDIELARKIQMALLPQKLPRLERAEIHYKYVPMMGVGGDFVDILIPGRDSHDAGGNAVCFFICDVSGHGVSAALTAAMVKMTLSSWETDAGNPARLLENISGSLKGKTGGNFITAISCYVELETGRLVYANAGHPPLIIVRSGGIIELVKTKGRLMSDHIQPDCEDAAVPLHDNDVIVLYTDGIIEERAGDVFYGEERFFKVLRSSHRGTVEELCSAVYNSVIDFKGNNMFDDDFTILAMRYRSKR